MATIDMTQFMSAFRGDSPSPLGLRIATFADGHPEDPTIPDLTRHLRYGFGPIVSFILLGTAASPVGHLSRCLVALPPTSPMGGVAARRSSAYTE